MIGTVLADKCADQLGVTLDKSLYGGSFEVTFFYGSEQSGETLKVELYRNGVLQDSSVYGPASTGSYDGTNPGRVSFTLPNVYWDEIRFIGNSANVADASDFLVESISGVSNRPELGGDSATGFRHQDPGPRAATGSCTTATRQHGCVRTTALTFRPETPRTGANIVGEYCIVNNGNGTYTATYDHR